MKITKKQLEKIVKEELQKSMQEGELDELGLKDIGKGIGKLFSKKSATIPQSTQAARGAAAKMPPVPTDDAEEISPEQIVGTETDSTVPPMEPVTTQTTGPGEPVTTQTFMTNFKASYDELENNIKNILTDAGAEPVQVNSFIRDLSAELAKDLQARKDIMDKASAPLTLAEELQQQEKHLINVSDLIGKHIKSLNEPRIRKILKQVQQFVSTNQKFVNRMNPSAMSIDVGYKQPESAAAEKEVSSTEDGSTSSTGLPGAPTVTGTTAPVSAVKTQAGTQSPEAVKNVAGNVSRSKSVPKPIEFGTNLKKKAPIAGTEEDDAMMPPPKDTYVSGIRESKKTNSYDKLYENWKRFTKG
jgi:hypothetical protein